MAPPAPLWSNQQAHSLASCRLIGRIPDPSVLIGRWDSPAGYGPVVGCPSNAINRQLSPYVLCPNKAKRDTVQCKSLSTTMENPHAWLGHLALGKMFSSCPYNFPQWFSGRLQYLQCISTGDTAVLRLAIHIRSITLNFTSQFTVRSAHCWPYTTKETSKRCINYWPFVWGIHLIISISPQQYRKEPHGI